MIEIELDGKKVDIAEGSTVMHIEVTQSLQTLNHAS